MKERPILFSGEMVRAILDGRKSQTRRIFKQLSRDADPRNVSHDGRRNLLTIVNRRIKDVPAVWQEWEDACPFGAVGDRLWVRENGWEPCAPSIGQIAAGADTWPRYEYDADGVTEANAEDFKAWGWKRRPSIHMPRWASRITLEITGVRVERLRDISEDDARAEAAEPAIDLMRALTRHETEPTSRAGFMALWNSLNEKRGYGWNANPWVWVIEFKRVEPLFAEVEA